MQKKAGETSASICCLWFHCGIEVIWSRVVFTLCLGYKVVFVHCAHPQAKSFTGDRSLRWQRHMPHQALLMGISQYTCVNFHHWLIQKHTKALNMFIQSRRFPNLCLLDSSRIKVFSFHVRCDRLSTLKQPSTSVAALWLSQRRALSFHYLLYATLLSLNDFVGNVVLVKVEQTIQECFGIHQDLLKAKTLKEPQILDCFQRLTAQTKVILQILMAVLLARLPIVINLFARCVGIIFLDLGAESQSMESKGAGFSSYSFLRFNLDRFEEDFPSLFIRV